MHFDKLFSSFGNHRNQKAPTWKKNRSSEINNSTITFQDPRRHLEQRNTLQLAMIDSDEIGGISSAVSCLHIVYNQAVLAIDIAVVSRYVRLFFLFFCSLVLGGLNVYLVFLEENGLLLKAHK